MISCKLSKNIGILFKIRHNLDRVTLCMLLMLYHTLILPYLEYCNIVWGNGNSVNFSNYLKRKKAVKAITSAISPIAMALSVSLCVCVFATTFVSTGNILAKIYEILTF